MASRYASWRPHARDSQCGSTCYAHWGTWWSRAYSLPPSVAFISPSRHPISDGKIAWESWVPRGGVPPFCSSSLSLLSSSPAPYTDHWIDSRHRIFCRWAYCRFFWAVRVRWGRWARRRPVSWRSILLSSRSRGNYVRVQLLVVMQLLYQTPSHLLVSGFALTGDEFKSLEG